MEGRRLGRLGDSRFSHGQTPDDLCLYRTHVVSGLPFCAAALFRGLRFRRALAGRRDWPAVFWGRSDERVTALTTNGQQSATTKNNRRRPRPPAAPLLSHSAAPFGVGYSLRRTVPISGDPKRPVVLLKVADSSRGPDQRSTTSELRHRLSQPQPLPNVLRVQASHGCLRPPASALSQILKPL